MNISTLISQNEIQKRVAELAKTINMDYGDNEVVLISILKGSFIFAADLCRHLTFPLTIDFVRLQSYNGIQSTGDVKLLSDLPDIKGERILVVEDIVDTGLTLKKFVTLLQKQKPLDVKVCCLLDKACNRQVQVKVDYSAFKIDNSFVVGYGLDFNEKLRNLPDICVLESY